MSYEVVQSANVSPDAFRLGKQVNGRGDQLQGRVLVVGDDMRIFLAVVRSLGRAGVEVHAAPFDWNAPALASKYVHRVHHLPRYEDSPEGWLDKLGQVLATEAIDLVIPCCDRAILPLDRHRKALTAYRVAIPNPRAMDLLFDKQCTKVLAHSLGIPVATGAQLEDDDTAHSLADRFGFPLVIKPRRSYWIDKLDTWGRVHIPTSMPELESALEGVEDRSRHMVEAYFKGGVGVGVSVLASNGAILQAFQHRRMREGWGGSSSYRISETLHPDLLEACRKLCESADLTGVCMFEFRWNPNHQSWVLLETNARFWGSMSLPLSVGVDFPRALFDLLVNGAVHPAISYRLGIRSRNFVLDGANLLGALRKVRADGIGHWLLEVGDFLFQPVRWVTGREHSDSFVADDLRPGFVEFLKVLRTKLFGKKQNAQGRRRSDVSLPSQRASSLLEQTIRR